MLLKTDMNRIVVTVRLAPFGESTPPCCDQLSLPVFRFDSTRECGAGVASFAIGYIHSYFPLTVRNTLQWEMGQMKPLGEGHVDIVHNEGVVLPCQGYLQKAASVALHQHSR